MSEESHWVILGLQPGASEQEIKGAFRRKAFEVHPDMGGSAEAFKRLYSAYESCLKESDIIVLNLDEIFEGTALAGVFRTIEPWLNSMGLSDLMGMRVVFRHKTPPDEQQGRGSEHIGGPIK